MTAKKHPLACRRERFGLRKGEGRIVVRRALAQRDEFAADHDDASSRIGFEGGERRLVPAQFCSAIERARGVTEMRLGAEIETARHQKLRQGRRSSHDPPGGAMIWADRCPRAYFASTSLNASRAIRNASTPHGTPA